MSYFGLDKTSREYVLKILEERTRAYFHDHPGIDDKETKSRASSNQLARILLEEVLWKYAQLYYTAKRGFILIFDGQRIGEEIDKQQKKPYKKMILEKLISAMLEELGRGTGDTTIANIMHHLELEALIDDSILDELENFMVTENWYILDRRTGQFLPISYSVIEELWGVFGERLEKHERVSHIFAELKGYVESGYLDPEQDFSRDPETKELTGMKSDYWDPIISMIPFPIRIKTQYIPEAKAPVFEQFLNTSVPTEYHTVLKRFTGYVISPIIMRGIPSVLVLLGGGANGKSTFLDILTNIFGLENQANISLSEIEYNRFSLASLYGKLININMDLPNISLASAGRAKAVLSGDPVMIEGKFRDPFSAKITAKHFFAVNAMPETRDKTLGFYRRFTFVKFDRTFIRSPDADGEPDEDLPFKLKKESAGIFNWLLEGYRELLETRDLGSPLSVEDVMTLYEVASNSLLKFIEEECEEEEGAEITISEFYNRYRAWCKSMRLDEKSKIEVGRQITVYAPYIERVKIHGERGYRNIRVKYLAKLEDTENRKRIKELDEYPDKAEYRFLKPFRAFNNSGIYPKGYIISQDELPEDLIHELLDAGVLEKVGDDA